MSAIVLDASVAVKLVSRETGSDVALRRVTDASEIIAPDWMALEVAHALWKKVQVSALHQAAAEAGVAALAQIVDRTLAADTLIPAALRLSYALPHPLYDCLYLAAAQAEGAKVLTADGKFVAIARQRGFGAHIEQLEMPS